MTVCCIVAEKTAKCCSPVIGLVKSKRLSACNTVFVQPDGNRTTDSSHPCLVDLYVNCWGLLVFNGLNNAGGCRNGEVIRIGIELVASRSGNLLNVVGASRELLGGSGAIFTSGNSPGLGWISGAGHLKDCTRKLGVVVVLIHLDDADTSDDGRSTFSAGSCVAIYPIGAVLRVVRVHGNEVTQGNTRYIGGAIGELKALTVAEVYARKVKIKRLSIRRNGEHTWGNRDASCSSWNG